MPSSSAPSPFPVRARRSAAANLFPSSSSASSSSATCCKDYSPSPTLDLLILILVLFSCTFLTSSSFAYIFCSLSQILPSLVQPLAETVHEAPLPYAVGFLVFMAASLVVAAEIPCGGGRRGRRGSWLGWWLRRCGNPRCRGLKKAMEFDVQLQTEESVRAAAAAPDAALWREIDGLPWKGGDHGNSPDYECLRVELQKMAPPNGRAVLLFLSRCGFPIAKLEAWGPKRGRRPKISSASVELVSHYWLCCCYLNVKTSKKLMHFCYSFDLSIGSMLIFVTSQHTVKVIPLGGCDTVKGFCFKNLLFN